MNNLNKAADQTRTVVGNKRKQMVENLFWVIRQEKTCTTDQMKARLLEQLIQKTKDIQDG